MQPIQPAGLDTADATALARKRHNYEAMNKKQLIDLLCESQATLPGNEINKLLGDIRDELRSLRNELVSTRKENDEMKKVAIQQHFRILDLEMAQCKNAVIMIDAVPANGSVDDAVATMHANRLPLDDMTSKFCLGVDTSRPRAVKCLFASDAAAKAFSMAAKTAGMKAKPDVPKAVRQDRQALNGKFNDAKMANMNPKFRGARLHVGHETYYVDPFTKAIVKTTLAPLRT